MAMPAAPGPPCPTCSSALRWFPDLRQWGCDRCRVMMPPAGPPPATTKVAKRGGMALLFGAILLGIGIYTVSDAPPEHTDRGGDIAAYEAANAHAEAVYQGGIEAAIGGVLMLVGIVRRWSPPR